MPFRPTDVPWWVWMLCALCAWGLRGLFEGRGSKRHGESVSGPLALVWAAVAVIAGALAFASLLNSIWIRPQ